MSPDAKRISTLRIRVGLVVHISRLCINDGRFFMYRLFIPSFLLACVGSKPNIDQDTIDQDIVTDADLDGYTSIEDCDDNNSEINPSAIELCDGIDNNCDGGIDENVLDIFYADQDGDGFGSGLFIVEACEGPEGYVSNGADCDDTSADSYPGHTEVCDGIDNDCNDAIDDEDPNLDLLSARAFYPDLDGDGFGDGNSEVLACSEGEGQVLDGSDCDDTDANIHPAALEICDGIDNDCDELLDLDDDSILLETGGVYYLDQDGDGFGNSSEVTYSCSLPEGYVEDATDCDDQNLEIHPAALEICDGIDNDCDEKIDDEDESVDTSNGNTYYLDSDGDGFGDTNSSVQFCDVPLFGFVQNDVDCNDAESFTYPGAAELEGSACLSDQDGDGYAPENQGGLDCNDLNVALTPSSTDIVGDNIDQNCDGIDGTDMDEDGFASKPSGGNDCDDFDSTMTNNCPPEIVSISIMGEPYNTEDLNCVVDTEDSENDPLSISYVWNLNGAEVSTQEVLEASAINIGDEVSCCAIASDDEFSSSQSCSSVLIIENRLSEVTLAELGPSVVYTEDTLVVSSILYDPDDAQSISAIYEWHVIDGLSSVDSIVQTGVGQSLDGSQFFDKGDSVYVVVIPSDDFETGLSSSSNTVIVSNTIPVAPTISITANNNPAEAGIDDLICSVDAQATDIDGDTLTYDYIWYDQNGDWAAETLSTTDLSDVFSGADTDVGIWTCEVVANDGEASSFVTDAVYYVQDPVCTMNITTSVDGIVLATYEHEVGTIPTELYPRLAINAKNTWASSTGTLDDFSVSSDSITVYENDFSSSANWWLGRGCYGSITVSNGVGNAGSDWNTFTPQDLISQIGSINEYSFDVNFGSNTGSVFLALSNNAPSSGCAGSCSINSCPSNSQQELSVGIYRSGLSSNTYRENSVCFWIEQTGTTATSPFDVTDDCINYGGGISDGLHSVSFSIEYSSSCGL